ncbi:Carboxyl-terminal-processing peptidase 1 chloroplastic [Zea mays]|uniref:Carboxyl-terminal-processing peptidase 1 chloroplastic n=1 Tax=Zea mays TaxID=4577 RepID=A0A1D6JU51_MAIZE|nr:Carboxyl-terminal-processing peptidase 1 chloroplastic [Zea mays]
MTIAKLFLLAKGLLARVMQGLIQSVFELHDSSCIVVTVGKYVTPNHKDINGNGIEPDYNHLLDFNEARDYLSRCEIKELS